MKLPRMTLSALFRKQSASEETEETIVDPTNPEETTAADTEESETEVAETVETTDPTPEASDPTNGDIVVTDPATETTETSASTETATDFQAMVQTLTTELNLFGSTIEARTAFRSEANRNRNFIEAMKNVGVVSDEDTTTAAEQNAGRKSYENAPWNQNALAKRK